MEPGELIDSEALVRLQEASYERAARGVRSSWPPESAMDAAQLRAFLEEHHYCVLATTTARGHAQARPVAFTVVGASLWFASVAGSRLRNLHGTPWGSVVVAEGDRGSHRAVIVDGPAVVVGRPPETLLDVWDARHGSRADWASAWFEIKPVRLFSYRGPGNPAEI
ncbi:pyridoxamine 5'-phosphate oxidase family protein [Gaiella sp.]|uniref:pyridoxamine 5'-phosphate oxidase family protein n=1 Tax=Gaiella sp. TaxID=2663207 RepID=UPI002E319E12|nr:pyridoxamine 5'-phosphate oxidase family protein [Gaiella sp.]HEX5584203.1 pyridoxamine 5'-phosphate oxidase family protein [Gaiella sp.]